MVKSPSNISSWSSRFEMNPKMKQFTFFLSCLIVFHQRDLSRTRSLKMKIDSNFLASTRRGKFPGKMPRGLSVLCCGDGAKINSAIPSKLTRLKQACFETHLFIKHQNRQSLKTLLQAPSSPSPRPLDQRRNNQNKNNSIHCQTTCVVGIQFD